MQHQLEFSIMDGAYQDLCSASQMLLNKLQNYPGFRAAYKATSNLTVNNMMI